MSQPENAILAVNSGSSSLKFALYPHTGKVVRGAHLSGNIDGLEPGGTPVIQVISDSSQSSERLGSGSADSFALALEALDQLLARHAGEYRPSAVAHRIVHGGARLAASVVLDAAMLDYLHTLSPLAPLHQPHNLAGVLAFQCSFPHLPQIGCFDTAFHTTLPEKEQMFALPKALHSSGIRRYGFHGLSYRYVSERLREFSLRSAGRVVIAHLGNGASACAIRDGKSLATTMGFSALDGMMMGTRSGALDPGVLLHLLRKGWDLAQLERMLYRESGLRGVSGISADMRVLHASDDPDAKLAVDIFTHRVVRECGALTACLGGLDVLVFTGGIGEHDAAVRAQVCGALAYLGVQLDAAANLAAAGNATVPIHTLGSGVEVWVVPTDEGRVAAQDAAALIQP